MSECPICNNNLTACDRYENGSICKCFNCGTFILPTSSTMLFNDMLVEEYYDKSQLKAYLKHNKISDRVFFIGTEEAYKAYVQNKSYSTALLVTSKTVKNWYPKEFSEKIDKILLFLNQHSAYDGDGVSLLLEELESAFLMKNSYEINSRERADENPWKKELIFLWEYLFEYGYLADGRPTIGIRNEVYNLEFNHKWELVFTLSAKAYARIYDLQKNQSNNKNVFIAMKFGKETLDLRDALKQAISKAGYLPVLIDEVQYNGQIVPEMLYQIRESRFVIAELSHHNNGAYYEAGYALGLGKEVIHICEEKAMGSKLHFDVKQVNTITYKADDLDGLKERLTKRIQATIK